MYFGTLEIESEDNGIVTLKNGDKIVVTEANKSLFTEEAITGSELQEKMVEAVANSFKPIVLSDIDTVAKTAKLVDILAENNLRLVDISKVWDSVLSDILNVKSYLDTTIEARNNEAIVNALGKDKLDTFSRVFGAKENAPNNSIRNIRMNDIFNT